MSREAFEAFMSREHGNMSLDIIGTGEYREWFVWRTWQAWQAARAAALEEAAEVCVCERISDEYQARESLMFSELKTDAQTGAGECADAIRALKEKE